MLDLDHRALSRLVFPRLRFGDDAVQTGSFEARQPVERNGGIARHGREMDWRLCPIEQLFERSTARYLRRVDETSPTDCKHVESDERRRRFLSELRYSRRRWMQSQLEGVEVEPSRGRDHDLAVDHAVFRQTFDQYVVQVRKVAIERPRVAALQIHVAV